MSNLRAILSHPDDFYPLLKLKLAARSAEKQIPPQPHWAFCYTMLHKVSRSFGLVIQQLDTDLRDAICIFYLVLRALDTVEDDTSIATDIKVPILMAFHRHIYDRDWHFACGTKEYKVLMDEFHHVSTAFLELGSGYQEAIEDITMRMGAGMAKFICKEVETVDDYDEYCHYVAGLVGLGLSKLFHASGKEDLASDALSNSMGLFLQKTNIIRDYLEDINEIPKSRMFWPRQIWSKYVNKLEDLKHEENSVKAVQCLNEMVTNALTHAEDCLTYMSALKDPSIFRFCAIPQIMAIGTLALCYNNIEVFRGVVKMRRGLTAKIIDRTKTTADVYGAFYDFSRMLKFKVDESDPNAKKTKDSLEVILKICRDSGSLSQRKSYIIQSKPKYSAATIAIIFIILAILLAYLSSNRHVMSLIWADVLVVYAFFVLQNYLTDVWGISFTHAAAILNIWAGICLILPSFCLYLVDQFLGHFRMLVLSSISYSVGILMVAMSTPPVLANSTGTCKQYEPDCIGHTHKTLFYVGMSLIAVGMSGNRVSFVPFLDKNQSGGINIRQGLGFFLVLAVAIIGALALPYIKPWNVRFWIPAVGTVVGMFMFLSGSGKYETAPGAEGSPITAVFKVFVASAKKRSQPFPPDATGCRQDANDPQSFRPTRFLRCLEKAAIKVNPDESINSVCTVAEIEDAKIVLRMIPMWMTFLICGIVSSIGRTYFVAQANHMNRKIGKWNVPLQALLLFYDNTARIVEEFADDFMWGKNRNPAVAGPTQPIARTAQPAETVQIVAGTSQPVAATTQPAAETVQPVAVTSQPAAATAQPVAGTSQPAAGTSQPVAATAQPVAVPAQPAFRKPSVGNKSIVVMGLAMIFSILCCITSARIEKRRIGVIIRHGLLEKPDDDIPMSIFWLLFQFFLLAVFDSFFKRSLNAFYADQAPGSMKEYLNHLTSGVYGLGFMSNVLSVYVVGRISERGGKANWFQFTLNKSRLDKYYWVLAGMSAVNFIIFVMVAWFYRFKENATNPNGENGGVADPQNTAQEAPEGCY